MRHGFRSLIAAAAMVAAATAGAAALPGAANASNNDGTCNGGEICLRYLVNQGGFTYDEYNNVSDLSVKNFPGQPYSANNNTQSSHNNSAWEYCTLYDNAGYSGNYITTAWNTYINDLGSMKDRGSSLKWFYP